MHEDRIRKLFLLAVVLGISALFVVMIRSFLMTLLLAAIFAALMRPVYLRLVRIARGREKLAALLTLVLLILGVFGPLATVLGIVVRQALQFTNTLGPAIKPFIENPQALGEHLAAIPGLERLQPYMPDIAQRSVQVVTSVATWMVSRVSDATSGTVIFVFNFAILLYALFFFLVEGPSYLRTVAGYLPFSEDDNQRLLQRFVSVTRATLKGTLLIGVIQGSVNGLGFWLVGLPAPAFWGAVMIVLSLVPVVGGALIWVPAAAWLLATRQFWPAIVLTLVCGGISGSVDNLLRPRLVGRDTKMPDLLILVSTLGGLGLFGAVGFIVGPLVAALFLTLWEMLGMLGRAPARAQEGSETPASAPGG